MHSDYSICFICNKSDTTYNLNYSSMGYSIKQDILQIFDFTIEEWLNDSDSVCYTCMEAIKNFARMKLEFYEIIRRRNREESYSHKAETPLSLVWEPFIRKIAFLGGQCPNGSKDHLRSYTPIISVSPSNLLVEKYAIAYNESPHAAPRNERSKSSASDKEVNQILLKRKKSRPRSRPDIAVERPTSSASDKEVNQIFSKRKKSRPRSRPASSKSFKDEIEQKRHEMIVEEFIRRKTESKLFVTEEYVNSLWQFFQDIEFLKPRNTSRCMSTDVRLRDKLTPIERSASEPRLNAHREDSEFIGTRINRHDLQELHSKYSMLKYDCNVKHCLTVCDDLMAITNHRVEMHGEIARYWCNHCKFNFITQDDLNRHDFEKHNQILENCPCCSQVFQGKLELHKHLQEHLKHQVPCIYCDKYFLRKDVCAAHVRQAHRGRRKRIKTMQPKEILARIYKNGTPPVLRNNIPTDFTVTDLVQTGTSKSKNSSSEQPDKSPSVIAENVNGLNEALSDDAPT